MKNLIRVKDYRKLPLLLFGLAVLVTACEEGTTVRDADYPDQLIYMPAAVGGRFVINDIARKIGDTPVPGNPYRYVVDLPNRNFIVPLGVYRAGVDNVGEFTVNIAVNNDTINRIIVEAEADSTSADSTISLLPSGQYTMVNSVTMQHGEELAKFDLVIDLDFLRNNYPDSVYALGVSISSPDRETNPDLSTAIVVIHAKIMKPTAAFSFSPDESDPNTIVFTNNSAMATDYTWDFGDGSETSDEENPSHTYSTAGTYTVMLTAIGITSDEDKSIAADTVSIL